MCPRFRAYHFWPRKNRRNDRPVFLLPDDIRRGTKLSAARLNQFQRNFIPFVPLTAAQGRHTPPRIDETLIFSRAVKRPNSPAGRAAAPPRKINICGHTPRKLPLFRAISRIIADCAPLRRPVIIQHSAVCVKLFLKFFSVFFTKFTPPCFSHHIWGFGAFPRHNPPIYREKAGERRRAAPPVSIWVFAYQYMRCPSKNRCSGGRAPAFCSITPPPLSRSSRV